MAYSFVQAKEADSVGTSDTTIGSGALSGSATAGNMLVAFVWWEEGQTGTVTCSLAGGGGGTPSWQAESVVSTTVVGDTTRNLQAFYALNITGGSTAECVATFSQSVLYPAIYIAEYSGFKTSAARLAFAGQNQATPGTGSNGVTSGLLGTLSAQPAGIVAFTFEESASNTPSAGTDFTARASGWDYGATAGARLEDRRVTATTSVAGTFTAGADTQHKTVAWAFEEATGGGGDPPITDGPKLVSVRSNIRFN
jgi:hypothetical protein